MSTRALRIWEHGEVEVVQLPGTHAAQIRELAHLVGGPTNTGMYHRQAVLHIHGTGAAAQDLQFNASAWALASAWRGLDITYGLYGPIMVTGPGDPAGGYGALAPHLESQIHDVCAAVSDVHAEWRTRPPAGEAAARAELLAAARHQVSVA
ncbi:hypothetical protein [Streptomyces sp. Root55]|uniref:hypothetical protein n=1 Tax=Streptomyces sp. Root55 TaxID=1736554 RepID=UPI0006F80BEF|nr:hypothetical protein [Streptomyces sp. Root55]